jgi:hypothetical protein
VVTTLTDGFDAQSLFFYASLAATGTHALHYGEAPYGAVIDDATAQPLPAGTPRIAVSEMRRPNGIGGHRSTTYHYKGSPLYNTQNLGFVGFAERRITEHDVPDYNTAGTLTLRDITTYVQQRLGHPFIGAVTQRLVVLNNNISDLNQRLSHDETLWLAQTMFGGAVALPYVSRDMTREYLSGAVVSASVTTHDLCFRALSGDTCPTSGTLLEYPTQRTTVARIGNNLSNPTFTPGYWGDVPSRTISTERSSETQVVNLSNDTVGWVIGFPVKRMTTLTGVGATAITRTETFTRHGTTSAPATAVRLPGTDHALTTGFSYTARGNVSQISLSGPNMTTQSSQFSSFMDDRYPLWVTNAEGHASNLDYDRRFGTPRMVTDANNRTT